MVGLGRWGQNLLREFEKISEVAPVPHHGPPSYENILSQPEIQAVVIATPIATHYALAKQALEAGKHVLVEKPLAESTEQAAELVRLAQEKKLILAVGHVFLYHPVLDKIIELTVREKITNLEFAWYKYGTFVENIHFNLLVHDLAIMLYLMGQPEHLKPVRSESDIFEGVAEFADGKKANFYLNRVAPFKNKSVMIKTKTQTLWWQDDQLFKLGPDGYELIYQSEITSLERECAAFLDAISNRPSGSITPLRNTGDLGLEVVKLLQMIKQ